MASKDGEQAVSATVPRLDRNHSTSGDGSVFHRSVVYSARFLLVATAIGGVVYEETLQSVIDGAWAWLSQSWVYNSVYFETWCVTVCYAVMTGIQKVMHHMPWFDRYKIDPTVQYSHKGPVGMVIDAIVYDTPLMLLDTFKIKRYPGISPEKFRELEQSWIQTERPLPVEPPTVGQFVFQLGASIMLFDTLFFFIHYAMHRSRFLYKYIHRYHHDHDVLNCHVTNQLTIPERLALILSANEALKILSSHPLTRTVFIPVFIWMLIDNHSGYDLPWGAQWVIPFGLYGGPVKHYFHHDHGARFYQPFFGFFDKIIDKERNNNCKKLDGNKEKSL